MRTRLHFTLLLVLLLLLVLEVGLRLGYSAERQLQRFATKLETYLQQAIDEVDIDLRTQHTLQRFTEADLPQENSARLSHLLWYKGDSLVAWAHPSSAPIPNLEKLTAEKADKLQEIDQVLFLKRQYTLLVEADTLSVTALIPIYYQKILDGVHTQAHFPMALDIPQTILFHKSKGTIPVSDPEGSMIGYLEFAAPYVPPLLLALHTIIYGGIIFILCVFLGQFSWHLSRQRPSLGIIFLISLLIPFRWIVLAVWTSAPFPPSSFVRQIFEIPVLNISLGTLLINVLLLLWLLLFTLRVYPRTEIRPTGIGLGLLLNLLNYRMIILA
ncbi:MAG: hypothetical protein KDC44_13760, partial [Phaeodactylibacter sp.]|nr:hypothetical protein [Phaeodactylibacter sp.]